MKHTYLKNVVTLNLVLGNCTGCGICIEVCPHNVITIENNRATIIDKNSCMECGACAKNCPVSAVNVKAGVGCALAVIMGWLTGKEPSCGCDNTGCC